MASAGPAVVILDDGDDDEIAVAPKKAAPPAAARAAAFGGLIDVDEDVLPPPPPPGARRPTRRTRPADDVEELEVVAATGPPARGDKGAPADAAVVAVTPATSDVNGVQPPGCDACGAAALPRHAAGAAPPVPWLRVARCRHGLCAACALGAVAVGVDDSASASARGGTQRNPKAEAAAAGNDPALRNGNGVTADTVTGVAAATADPALVAVAAAAVEAVAVAEAAAAAIDAVAASTSGAGADAAAGADAVTGADAVVAAADACGVDQTAAAAAGDAASPPTAPLPSLRADPCCPVARCRAPLSAAEAERCLASPDADAAFGPALTAFGAWYGTWADAPPAGGAVPLPVPPGLATADAGVSGPASGARTGVGARQPPLLAAPRSAVQFQIGLVLFDGEEDDGSWLTDDLPAAFAPLWVAAGGGLSAAVAAASASAAAAGAAAAATTPPQPPGDSAMAVDGADPVTHAAAPPPVDDAATAAAHDAATAAADASGLPVSIPLTPVAPPVWRCALCGGGSVPRPPGAAGRHAPAWVHCGLARAVGVVEIVRALRKSLAYSTELESELVGEDDLADGDGDGEGGGAAAAAGTPAAPTPDAATAGAGAASGKRLAEAGDRTLLGRFRKRRRGGAAAGGPSRGRAGAAPRGFVKGTGYGGNKGPEWKAKGAALVARDAADDATAAGWLGRLRCFLLPPREAPPRGSPSVVGGAAASWPPYLRLLLRRTGLVTVLGRVFMNNSMMEIGQRAVLYTACLGVVTALTSVASLSSLLTEHVTDDGATVASLVDGMAKQARVLTAGAGAVNLPPATGALVKQVRRAMRALNRADVLHAAAAAEGGTAAADGEDAPAGEGDAAAAQAATEAAYVRAMKPVQFEFVPDLVDRSTYRTEASRLSGVPGGPAAKGRLLRLSQEVASLSGSLPLFWASGVLLRVDEDRFDVLRALVFGPEGTPYAHGAFVFDFFLPAAFPRVPPAAKLLTTGGGRVRFNPNLYKDGRVCLSLLGTWAGPSWTEASTLLQVLVSIQSLILVPEPYFNEPGYEGTMGTASGRAVSTRYNVAVRRNTVVYAMIDALRRPPPEFRAALQTHFRLKRDAIRATVAGWVAEGGGPKPAGYHHHFHPSAEPAVLTQADLVALEAELDKLTVGPS